ncbi:hypothetical protein F5887DRAFT_1116470 [Amanita rubescens]|nr:hypothetical protein F5887DRAFT_1116470 [Amanita rubescens]
MSKVILVTGANTGIGYELLNLLAQKGHKVYLGARNEAAGRDAAMPFSSLFIHKKENLDVTFVLLDVTSIETIKVAKDSIEQSDGKLDVLVNNAGIGTFERDQNASTADVSAIRDCLEVNLIGLVQTTTTFLPLLRASPQAVILNVSTEMASNSLQAGPNARIHVVAYNTSKAAANSYTITLAQELKKDGIKVNAVTPGLTTTKLNNFHAGGKTTRQGAESLLPWALLNTDGPTASFWTTGDRGWIGDIMPLLLLYH